MPCINPVCEQKCNTKSDLQTLVGDVHVEKQIRDLLLRPGLDLQGFGGSEKKGIRW